MKILVTGANGLVGRAVVARCRALGDEVFAHTHQSLDITNENLINARLDEAKPDAMINCAAWTDVDGCEIDPERAHLVNAVAVESLALASRRVRATFVTISTDYVFDGDKQGFYTQRDDPAPQNIYGIAKLQGERRAQFSYARTIVVRTGWIFGADGTNFLARIFERARRAAETGESIKAIHDAYGTPTYADDLAARLRELVARDLPGIYHVTGGGDGASFEQFTREAVEIIGLTDKVKIESVSGDSLKRPAPRPRNSCLRCLLSEAIGLAPLPNWRDALRRFAARN